MQSDYIKNLVLSVLKNGESKTEKEILESQQFKTIAMLQKAFSEHFNYFDRISYQVWIIEQNPANYEKRREDWNNHIKELGCKIVSIDFLNSFAEGENKILENYHYIKHPFRSDKKLAVPHDLTLKILTLGHIPKIENSRLK